MIHLEDEKTFTPASIRTREPAKEEAIDANKIRDPSILSSILM